MRARPASTFAWILGVLFVIACPQSIPAAATTLVWLLTTSAGAAVLGAALLVTLVYCAAARPRYSVSWGRSW